MIEKNKEAKDEILKFLKWSTKKRKRKNDTQTSSFHKKQRTQKLNKKQQILIRYDNGVLREFLYTEAF